MKLDFKPEPTEFAPSYSNYLDLVPESDIRDAYAAQPAELRAALESLPEDRGTFAYDEGKWTIKEVVSHIIDCERIFAYRMHRISRGDATPIEGFDQESPGYTAFSHANERTFSDLLEEFELVRRSNSLMLNNMDEADLRRMGTANELSISVRALAGIMIGHVRHHLNILKERYLG
ncbi:MAG: DinB family protein [Pyrinomonadaceae bacterium]|nr:DinB family protein [Pyrinomonadaceae bacterium]